MKARHEKSQYLNSTSFKTAEYLTDSRFSRSEATLLFKLRSKTLNIKMNFKKQHKSLLCQVCGLFPECQSHLLQCPQIAPKLNLVCEKKLPDENQIYGSIDDQLRIVKIYTQIMDLRKEILNEKEDLQS